MTARVVTDQLIESSYAVPDSDDTSERVVDRIRIYISSNILHYNNCALPQLYGWTQRRTELTVHFIYLASGWRLDCQ